MQRLRKAANFVQRTLRDFANFAQVSAQTRVFRHLISGPAEHGTHGRQNLSEFIVQFARNVAQSGFLGRDQFLRQFAALRGKRRELRKTRRFEWIKIQAGQHDRNQGRGKNKYTWRCTRS